MGRVSTTATSVTFDRVEDGRGVRDRVFTDEEILEAHRRLETRGSVHPNHETRNNCIRQISDGQIHNETCEPVRNYLLGLRGNAIPGFKGPFATMHGKDHPLQRAHGFFANRPFIEELRSVPVYPLRDDIQPRAARAKKLDGKVSDSTVGVFRIKADTHNEICNWLKDKPKDYYADQIYRIFMFGSDSRGVVSQLQVLKPGSGGCFSFPSCDTSELSRAMNLLIKSNLHPCGFGRMSDERNGGINGYWTRWIERYPNFKFIEATKKSIMAYDCGKGGVQMKYKIV